MAWAKQIGKYQIQGELGRGGCGQVFRALDPTVDRLVAIKVLTGDPDPHLLARFRREAAATAALRHRNIVTIYELGEHKGSPYIAMEYLAGETLQQVIAERRPLSLLEKMKIMAQVAEGLHSAHEAGVIHRDVKPANIMLLADGLVKIMDFGIAHWAQATPLTERGDLLGTVRYMSPEQFQSDKDMDARSDLFAYGVVYYELLTGRHPFEGSNAAQVMTKIASQDPPPIGSLAPECPEALEHVIHTALRKRRELRYKSLADLQTDAGPVFLDLQRERATALVAEAESLRSQGDWIQARNLVREVLHLDPGNAEGRRLWQEIRSESRRQATGPIVAELMILAEQEARDRPSEAIKFLESALEIDRDNEAARQQLQQARARLEEGRRRPSRLTPAYTPPAPAEAPAQPDAVPVEKKTARLLEEAEVELRRQQLTNAAQKAQAAVQSSPQNPLGSRLLDMIQRQRHRRGEQGRKREDGARLAIEQAGLLLSQDRPQDAIALLEKARAEYPGSADVALALEAAGEALAGWERRQWLGRRLDQAAQLEREGEWRSAELMLREAQEQFPQSAEVAEALARLRDRRRGEEVRLAVARRRQSIESKIAAGEWADAFAWIDSSQEEFPGEPDWEALRQTARADELQAARNLFSQRRFEDAEAILQRLAEVDPDDTKVKLLLHAVSLEREIEAEVRTQQRERERPQASWELGGYRLLELLGAGSQGVVWRAQDQRRNQLVALRVFPPEVLADPGVKSELLGRLHAAAALDHPNLVRIYDIGEDRGSLYVAMEHVAGRPASRSIGEGGLPAAEIVAYAAAYAGVAECQQAMALGALADPAAAMVQAQKAAHVAVRLDNQLAEARVCLATLTWLRDLDWRQAEKELLRILEQHPSCGNAHLRYAAWASALGREEDARLAIRRAGELDPLSPAVHREAFYVLYRARQYDLAEEECRKLLHLDLDFAADALTGIGRVHLQNARTEYAIFTLRTALNMAAPRAELLGLLGYACALAGERDDAVRIRGRLEELIQRHYASPFSAALICTGLGEPEEAFRWLQQGVEQRTLDRVYLNVEPEFDPLRADPRFQKLVRLLRMPR